MQALKFKQKLFEQYFVPPYVLVLIFIGFFMRKIKNPNNKQILCSFFGILHFLFCIKSLIDVQIVVIMQILNSLIIRFIGPSYLIIIF